MTMVGLFGFAAFLAVACGVSALIIRWDMKDAAADAQWWDDFMRSIRRS